MVDRAVAWWPDGTARVSWTECRASLQPQVPHAELVEADVVRELVADGAGDLVAQHLRVVAEVAAQGVAVDDDAVGHVVAGGAVAVVEAVGAAPPAAVGDDDRDVVVLDEVAQQ